MSETMIVPTNNVEGNITSCKIETSPIKVDRHSVWSLTEKTTYRSYDVCTKQTIDTYTKPEFTGMLLAWPVIICVGVCVLTGVIAVAVSIWETFRGDNSNNGPKTYIG
jgi:hypothetical protein